MTPMIFLEGKTSRRGIVPALYRLNARGYRILAVEPVGELGELLQGQEIPFERIPAEDVIPRVVALTARGELDPSRVTVVGLPTVADALGVANVTSFSWAELANELLSSARRGKASRSTKETRVQVEVNLDGTGKATVKTGIEYFDHMLEQIAKHGGIDLNVQTEGDLGVDEHHTVEDTALVLGKALQSALGGKHGIARYGFWLPMDEASAKATIDLSGRPYLVFKGRFSRDRVGGLPTEMVSHFYRSLSFALEATLHVEVEGENAHHMVESTFKAFGRALRMAVATTGRDELPSTKGSL